MANASTKPMAKPKILERAPTARFFFAKWNTIANTILRTMKQTKNVETKPMAEQVTKVREWAMAEAGVNTP